MSLPKFGICSPQRIFQKGFLKPVSLGVVSDKNGFNPEAEVNEIVESNIKIIKWIRLPKRFSEKEVIDFLEKMIRDDIKGSKHHQQGVELVKYAKDFHKYFTKYYSKVFDFHEKQNDETRKFLFNLSHMFLRSDFPPSFVRTFSFSLLTDIRFNNVYDAMIRHEKLSVINYRNNNVKFKRICDDHNKWVSPLVDIGENIWNKRIGLLWHIEFCNSKSLKEVFKPKDFKLNSIDHEFFFKTVNEIQKETEQLRRMAANLDKRAFATIDKGDEATKNMFNHVVNILAS